MPITVFDQQISTAAVAVAQANLNIFNEASNGAIVAGSGDFLGDWFEKTMWAAQQIVARRNAYGTGKVTPVELSQILERAVKVDQRVGPLSVTPAIMERLGKNPEEAASVFGTLAAQQLVQDQLNVGISAFLAATPDALTYDFTTDTTASFPTIRGVLKARRILGDASQRIVCNVMSGATWNDLIVEGTLQNTSQLFKWDNIAIMQDGLGARFLVTDALGLDADEGTGATAKARQRVLSLQAAAIVIDQHRLDMYSNDVLGGENVQILRQGETSFNLSLRGYTYVGKAGALGAGDKATSPTDAANRNSGDTADTIANGGSKNTLSASPNDATLFAKSSWQVTDSVQWAGGPAAGKAMTQAQMNVAKNLGGIVSVFGLK